MNLPRMSLARGWILPLTLVGALACNKGSGDVSTAGGSNNGPGSGSGTMGARGIGWWTTPPPNPGTGVGGTPTGGGGSGSGGPGSGGPGTGTGNTGAGGPGSPGGTSVTVPGSTGGPMTPHLPGGGVAGGVGLAPGCTPASANECPTINGACATGQGATVTVTKFGTLCLAGEMSSFNLPAATVEYILENTNGQKYYRFRVTFNPYFDDNTYGVNSIGWPVVRGHRYSDLVKSDHTELQLLNAAGELSLHFKMDYISANTARMCGYGTLGVNGGDGHMLVGNPAYVLAVGTSLDRNLNACGYCKSPACNGDCTVDSPATDDKYTTNPQTPNWDFRLVYDVWIAPEAFGPSGFGKANISYVHASPAKGGSDTIIVTPKPCPPMWDNPYPGSGTSTGGSSGGGAGTGGTSGGGTGTGGSSGGGSGGPGSGSTCPVNYTEYLTSEGKPVCVPNATPGSGTGGGYTCPIDWMLFITSEGKATCIPAPTPTTGTGSGSGGGAGGGGTGNGGPVPVGPGNSCPINYEIYVSSEGKSVCLPSNTGTGGKGKGGGGGGGDAGGVGVPVGAGNSCPVNYEVYVSSEGKAICLPTGTGGSGTGTGTGGGNVPINPDGTCPNGYTPIKPMEGPATQCAPTSGGGTGGTGGSTGSGSGVGSGGGSGAGLMCPIDWTLYLTSEGKNTCTPTPRGGSCPIDWTTYLTSEGKNSCVPTPRNGVCPEGYHYDVSSEGKYCL
jgi:hypothetical protein